MPISQLTSTSVFQSGTGNRTVSPNASAAVGDVMVLPVGFQDSSATTITTPTGWTVQKSAVLTGTLKTSLFTRTRQSGDASWTYAPNQSVETSDVVLSIGGGDPASLLIGADGTRAASGGTTATTAPSITTTAANTRVYVIATERTTANETVEATVNNGFAKILHAYSNGTSAESIFIGYKDIAAAGAVGATTVTFQNSQATNGYAVLIAVAPASAAQSISGTVAVITSAAASVTSRQMVTGASVATSGAAASFTVTRSMSATVSAQSAATAVLTSTGQVSGATEPITSASGLITITQTITATLEPASGVTASFTASTSIASTVNVTSSATGSFATALEVSGVVSVTTSATADLTVREFVPTPPIPDTRTLTGAWSATLIEAVVTRTLAGTPVQHTLEDA